MFGASTAVNEQSINIVDNQPKSFKTARETAESTAYCNFCYQKIRRGYDHNCNSKKRKVDNVVEIINELPLEEREKVIGKVLRQTVQSKSSSAGSQLELRNIRGPATKVNLNSNTEKIQIPVEHLDNFQNANNITTNMMRKFDNLIRSHVGRDSIPSHHETHMSEQSNILAEYYKSEEVKFEVDSEGNLEKRTVVYADAEELLLAVAKYRNFGVESLVKVMADGGQKFFKICVSVYPKNYSPEHDCSVGDIGTNEDTTEKSLYKDGGSSGKKAKLSSVKRVILLCIVPQIKESYYNVDILFKLTKLNKIKYKFVSDLKLLLITVGQQTATSTFPCPYCFVSINDLRKRDVQKSTQNKNQLNKANNKQNSKSKQIPDSQPKELNRHDLKTFGLLRIDYEQFCNIGKNKKMAKKCHSTVNLPMFEEKDDVCVLEKCPVPELHLLLGFTNHLFFDGLVPLLGREKAFIWPQKLHLISKSYQGEVFEGNACRKLIQKADDLMDPDIVDESNKKVLKCFVAAFKSLDTLVTKYFSTTLGDLSTIDSDLKKFKNDFAATGVSETLKIHIITDHLKQSIQYLGQEYGLVFWSEQAGESIHSYFLKTWIKYMINDMTNPNYSKQLLKAAIEFSSKNL